VHNFTSSLDPGKYILLGNHSFLHRLLELSPPCFVLSFRGPWVTLKGNHKKDTENCQFKQTCALFRHWEFFTKLLRSIFAIVYRTPARCLHASIASRRDDKDGLAVLSRILLSVLWRHALHLSELYSCLSSGITYSGVMP
jgi:hypothetical protein